MLSRNEDSRIERANSGGPLAAPRRRTLFDVACAVGLRGASHFAFPLALFVVSRTALLAASYISVKLVPNLFLHQERRHMSLLGNPALDGLCRWDCGWFERIMQRGFDDLESAKIFPLYPALGWSLSHLADIDPLVALIIIANLASLASYVVIYAIFKRLDGALAARWGLIFFVAYPFAFFQGAAYAESLMALMSSGAILLAMNQKHIRAGVVLGLGIMARHVTIFAGAGLLAAQLRQRGLRRFFLSPALIGLVVPFAFVGVWSWYLGKKVGDPLAFWNARGINFGPDVFWSIREVFINVPYASRPELYFYMIFSLIPAAGAIALCTRKRWIELAAAAGVLMCVIYGSGGIALGRYSAACWPAFLPWGVALSRWRSLQLPLLVVMVFIQGTFFYLFTHQWPVL